jgi:branched-chain amino acid transport system substrate-binding protein
MESLNLVPSNRQPWALSAGLAVVLATLLLLPVLSSARGSEESVMAPFYAHQGTARLSNGPVITIGVGVDLSSPGTIMGWQELNSVQLAISQTNAAGGVNVGGVTYTLALVSADSAGDPTQTITAANTLLNAGAVAVVGHSWSRECLAAQPIYSAAGVAVVSPSCTRPIVTQQGYSTTFRTIPHDGTPGTLLAGYFRALGLSRSAIVDSGYLEVGDFYSNTFTALGGTITSRRTINDTGLFTDTLTAILAENADVIADFIQFQYPDDPAIHGEFSRIAYGLGMTDVVIAWDTFINDDTLLITYADAAGAAAEGDVAAMEWRRFTNMPGWTTFLADYQAAAFAKEPDDPDVYGAFAYDAARIIIAAIDRADSTNSLAVRNQVAVTMNHEGVVGTYQAFDARGDVIPQWGWLERYQNGQWAIMSPNKVFLPLVLRDD